MVLHLLVLYLALKEFGDHGSILVASHWVVVIHDEIWLGGL